MRTKLHRN